MCRIFGVTRQGYYAYARALGKSAAPQDEVLLKKVRAAHKKSGGRYGVPRVHKALKKDGIQVSRRRVARLMKALGLRGRGCPRTRQTTRANPAHSPASNTLNRQFHPSAPDKVWVTDITYILTHEGWAYLSVVIDLFARRVVGFALEATMPTALPLRALNDAITRRRPKPGLLHHSDRGCQYTSREYQEALASAGIQVSMSRRGNCWDNAVAESFFATLKKELIYERPWRTRTELRSALFEYIHVFYNRERLHSTLGYMTPEEYERAHFAAAA